MTTRAKVWPPNCGCQSDYTELGPFAEEAIGCGGDVSRTLAAVQGAMIHADNLHRYDVSDELRSRASRTTLTALDRIVELRERCPGYCIGDDVPLERRSVGTCRDYALMLVALLRAQGIAARVRCGFAAYFKANHWEDHWLVEYQDRLGNWHWADAQMDEVHRRDLGIEFDPADVPREKFLSSADIADAVLEGTLDASLCGHGRDTGLWFIHVNLARDALALQGWITSDWDRWREVPQHDRSEGMGRQRLQDLLRCLRGQGSSWQAQIAPYWL